MLRDTCERNQRHQHTTALCSFGLTLKVLHFQPSASLSHWSPVPQRAQPHWQKKPNKQTVTRNSARPSCDRPAGGSPLENTPLQQKETNWFLVPVCICQIKRTAGRSQAAAGPERIVTHMVPRCAQLKKMYSTLLQLRWTVLTC